MKEEPGLRERKLNDTKVDSEGLPGWVTVMSHLSYIFGFQPSICGEYIPYKKRRKLFIYFGFKPPAKIYLPLDLLLKNKNTFAMMVSSLGVFHHFPDHNIIMSIN